MPLASQEGASPIIGNAHGMSRERRRNIYLILFLLVGVSLSGILFWSIDQWSRSRVTSRYSQTAMSWGHRIGREIETDVSTLSSLGVLLSELKTVDRLLLVSIMDSMVSDDTISGVGWAPEVTERGLISFLDSYPEFSFEEQAFRDQFVSVDRIFPVALVSGNSDALKLGLELSQDERWSEPLQSSLQNARLHPREFLQAGADRGFGILLFQPLVINLGEGLGLLLAEIDFRDIMARTVDESTGQLGLQLYDAFPPESDSHILYRHPQAFALKDVSDATVVFPLQVGDTRWGLAFYPLEPPQSFSWEAALAGIFGLVLTLSVASYGRTLFDRASSNELLVEESIKALKSKDEDYRVSMGKLHKAEERYSDLFEKSQALIWTQELDGKIRSLNPAAADSLGYRPQEMRGRSLQDFVLPTERHNFGNYLDRCKNSDSTRGLLKLYTKNGATRFWM